MKDFDIEERVNRAVRNFEAGYNCAQSVFLAYSDVFELDMEMAKKMSVSFGGGVARMREICGTVSAMAMLAGFKYPVLDITDQEARTKNYAMVQKKADMLKEKKGTNISRRLITPKHAATTTTAPAARTQEYYQKRPCGRFVEDSARIAGRMLKGELD